MKKIIIVVFMIIGIYGNCFGDSITGSWDVGNIQMYAWDEVPIKTTLDDNDDFIITIKDSGIYTREPSVIQLTEQQMNDFLANLYGDETITIPPNQIQNKEEVIKYFIESGDVCDVIGHQWREGGDWQSMIMTLQVCYNNYGKIIDCEQPKHRECGICGKIQKQNTTTEWIDIE